MGLDAILSLIVLACAAGVGIAGTRLRRDDIWFFIILMFVLLLPSIWIPRFWRDLIVSAGAGLLLSLAGGDFIEKLKWGLGTAGPLYALSWVVPGGASVALISISLIGL